MLKRGGRITRADDAGSAPHFQAYWGARTPKLLVNLQTTGMWGTVRGCQEHTRIGIRVILALPEFAAAIPAFGHPGLQKKGAARAAAAPMGVC
jgi:hypothetical protein